MPHLERRRASLDGRAAICALGLAMLACEVPSGAEDAALHADASRADATGTSDAETFDAFDGGVSDVVTLTSIVHHHTSAGTLERSTLPGPAPIEILIEHEGTFSTLAAESVREGRATFRGVPSDAWFYLRLGSDYVITRARSIDVGNDVIGRAEPQRASSFESSLSLDVDGLVEWEEGADLELVATNAGLFHYSPQHAGPALTLGSTSASLSVQWYGQPLLDGALGDRLLVTQLVPGRSDEGTPYLWLARAWESSDAFVMRDGPSALSAHLGALPTETLDVEWRRAAFASLGAEIHPDATSLSREGGVASLGAAPEHGALTPWGHVLRFPRQGLDHDERFVSLPYANPTGGALFGYALETWAVRYALGDAAQTVMAAVVSVEVPYAPSSELVLTPRVTPVRDLRIEEQSADSDSVGVGTTPLVRWSAGTSPATSYVLALHEVSNVGGLTRIAHVGAILTTRTEARVPPGLLEEGRSYVLLVRAVHDAVSAEEHPFRRSLPHAVADRLSAFITP